MIVIVGCIVVLAAIISGFTMAGGHLGALFHPSEIVTICGAASGSLIVMSPKKVLVDLLHGLIQCVKGTPYNKRAYEDLLKVSYELFRLARREGLIALEQHLSSPEESSIFKEYPNLAKNHHVVGFISGALSPIIEGTAKPEQLPGLLASELKVMEEEHHAPIGVLVKTADALPGFGIVAAVLGIVITMSAIDGPVEEIGEKVGAALVGTFLGILASYGFVAPLSVKMEFVCESEMAYFRTIATLMEGFANNLPPKIALDYARRGLRSEFRISREELDKLFAEVEGGQTAAAA